MNELNNGSLEKTNLDNNNSDNTKLDNSDLDKNTLKVEEKSSNIVYRKTNKTSDIYERFINRVQGISESNIDKNSNNAVIKEKSSHTENLSEPLDNTEWQLSLETEQTLHNDQKIKSQQLDSSQANIENTDNALELSLPSLHEDPTLDNENDNAPAAVTTPVLPTDSKADPDIKQTSVSEDKQIGNLKLKLLIIGIVCGLLLSGLVVVILAMTGIFANNESATEGSNTVLVSADKPKVANEKTIANVEAENTSVTNLTDNTATIDELPVENPIDKSKLSDEQIQVTPSKTAVTDKVDPIIDTSDVEARHTKNDDNEAIISYEDFAEEAQSTLYRETNN